MKSLDKLKEEYISKELLKLDLYQLVVYAHRCMEEEMEHLTNTLELKDYIEEQKLNTRD